MSEAPQGEQPLTSPKPGRYFAPISPDRPIFQGDIFRGAFGAFWVHPDRARTTVAGLPPTPDPPFPDLDQLRAGVHVRGHGYGMLLPQPCEYSEGEKGGTHPFRLVAPLVPLDSHAGVDARLVREGRVGHTLLVPNWKPGKPQDFYVDLRLTASVDAAFITRDTRVAALSRVGWLFLARRLSRYFLGIDLNDVVFAAERASLYPATTPHQRTQSER